MDILIVLAIVALIAGVYFYRKRQKEQDSERVSEPPTRPAPRPAPRPPKAPTPPANSKPAPEPPKDTRPPDSGVIVGPGQDEPAPPSEPDPDDDTPPPPLVRDRRILVHGPTREANELADILGGPLPGTGNSTVIGIRRDHYAALRFHTGNLSDGQTGHIMFEETTHIPYGPIMVAVNTSPGDFGLHPNTAFRGLVDPGGVYARLNWILGQRPGRWMTLAPGTEYWMNLIPVRRVPDQGPPLWWNPDGADRAGAIVAGFG